MFCALRFVLCMGNSYRIICAQNRIAFMLYIITTDVPFTAAANMYSSTTSKPDIHSFNVTNKGAIHRTCIKMEKNYEFSDRADVTKTSCEIISNRNTF